MQQIPEYLTLEDNYAAYHPVGEFTFEQAVDSIDRAIAYCVDNEIRALLVDIRGMTGFPPPTTMQRFRFAERWSMTAAGRVFLAIISRPELIDPDRIGVIMANNRGLRAEVFTSHGEADKWLRPARASLSGQRS